MASSRARQCKAALGYAVTSIAVGLLTASAALDVTAYPRAAHVDCSRSVNGECGARVTRSWRRHGSGQPFHPTDDGHYRLWRVGDRGRRRIGRCRLGRSSERGRIASGAAVTFRRSITLRTSGPTFAHISLRSRPMPGPLVVMSRLASWVAAPASMP